jgi:hypothetical protein
MMLCASAYASEGHVHYSQIEQRLAALETQVAAQQGVQAASYSSHDGGAACAGCTSGCGCQSGCCESCYGGVYFDFDMLWIRPHVNEDFADGKLSEEHHFSPRFILGYENCCGIGGRLRYWRYDHSVDILDPGQVRFGMDVLDVEATNHLCFRRTDLVLGGGLRMADITLVDDSGDDVDCDALGLTLAADIRTLLCSRCCNTWSWVYGGRVAVMGGDWNGDNDFINTIVEPQVRDDNLFVQEIYAGLEYAYAFNNYDLFSRFTFELQNWRSDVLGEVSTTTDSISFIGPNVGFGVCY